MSEAFLRMAWFGVVACVLAYLVFLAGGDAISAKASGEDAPVVIRDALSAGTHHLSGMVSVPSSCDELFERSERLGPSLYRLRFSTWREPSVTCDGERSPRAFRDTVFAPAVGVTFVALLDDLPLPVLVLPMTSLR